MCGASYVRIPPRTHFCMLSSVRFFCPTFFLPLPLHCARGMTAGRPSACDAFFCSFSDNRGLAGLEGMIFFLAAKLRMSRFCATEYCTAFFVPFSGFLLLLSHDGTMGKDGGRAPLNPNVAAGSRHPKALSMRHTGPQRWLMNLTRKHMPCHVAFL